MYIHITIGAKLSFKTLNTDEIIFSGLFVNITHIITRKNYFLVIVLLNPVIFIAIL